MTVRGDRRVVCAACKVVNSKTGAEALLIGPRHFDSVMRAQWSRLNSEVERLWIEPNAYGQGFIGQWGVYMSRGEAWEVASKARQIIYREAGCSGPDLYSENLY